MTGGLDLGFTRTEFSSSKLVETYAEHVDRIGLWASERTLVRRHFDRDHTVLDLGCGAGRTTFGLLGEGFTRVLGVDLSVAMISAGRQLSRQRGVAVDLLVGDACALPLPSGRFDDVFFSFNGIMDIPGRPARQLAFNEVRRVLTPGGCFVFTTHDIDEPRFAEAWRVERERWDAGVPDPRLLEFGDKIFTKPDQYGQVECFVHVPTRAEVEACLSESGFELVDVARRSQISSESTQVVAISTDCLFWVARKP